ncbi:MAG: serine/threonine-protein kinase [Candidatus Magnetoovum sp. WYHC-5]|nr:serine/threonine-protein kinase [Candidatus Magnetoovum sp. WYHC-5]
MKRINLLYNITMGISNIGRYQISNLLGRGGMGVVYKGTDTIIDRVVAIKTIVLGKSISAVKEKELLDLFYREVKIAGRLNHPNIATIFDAGQHYDIHYFVMEYVEGVPLKKVIHDEIELPPVEKVKIIASIATSLHYAHQRGVIHRDIKPANIMILDDMQIKIMDFGIALLSSASDTISRTFKDRIMGTPSYMSPEQIAGKEVDRQTDIFSLGAVAYEFLTNKKPFTASNMTDLFKNIRFSDPTPIHVVNPDIPKNLSDTIMKALEKNKEDRYLTASEFSDDLEVFISLSENRKHISEDTREYIHNREFLQSLKQKYTFFSDFSFEELNKIFKISTKHAYKEGDVIFKEGTVGKKMYIILSGKVKIIKYFEGHNEESILNHLQTGNCFGEMAFMESAPRFASAVAETDCMVLAINEVILRKAEPGICLKLYKNLALILSEKLRKSDEKNLKLFEQNKKLLVKLKKYVLVVKGSKQQN